MHLDQNHASFRTGLAGYGISDNDGIVQWDIICDNISPQKYGSSVLRNGLQVHLSNTNCLNLILVALPTVGVGDTTLSLKSVIHNHRLRVMEANIVLAILLRSRLIW